MNYKKKTKTVYLKVEGVPEGINLESAIQAFFGYDAEMFNIGISGYGIGKKGDEKCVKY